MKDEFKTAQQLTEQIRYNFNNNFNILEQIKKRLEFNLKMSK